MPNISLLILDVDGVLTDGTLPFEGSGNQTKVFHVRDGSALKRWHEAGGRTALISGRQSSATAARAAELGIDAVFQNAGDKLHAFDEVCRRFDVTDAEVCYVGDDLPDVGPMRRAGHSVAVADAAPTVKRAAAQVTQAPGGRGAVAEVIETLLRRAGSRPAAASHHG